jgi:diaminohydroxyphosphoribosylaminopyrimidine deaminase/5-amino-6-(5-phosphoribosylamino)uracil reductase
MPLHSADEQHLHRALERARGSIGLASPNPYVGAVIVDHHGDVVGEGTYTYDGKKHAEILALEAAGEKARGGTLYINLEPDAHQGRTPPCTDEVGGLEEDARRLNEAFARYIRSATPLVTLKAAMTLDGKIAPPPSEVLASSQGIPAGGWVTSEIARAHVQELRHQNDALMVGAGTILSDNPLLTDRSGRQRRRPLLRVILDSRLRLPLDSRLVQSVVRDRSNDVLVFCSVVDEPKKSQLEQLGIRVETLPAGPDARPDLPAILRRLGELELTSVMIEGGATVNWTALATNVVDKVFLYYAPKILAGTGSIPFAAGAGFLHMNHAAQVKHIQLHRFGEDFAVEGYLRDPYSS